MNVKYITLSRLSDGLIVASHRDKNTSPECSETVSRVLSSGNVNPNTQLTVTVNAQIGTLHLAAEEVDVVSVVTAANYPRRTAFQLLAEVREYVTSNVTPDMITQASSEEELKGTCKTFLGEVFAKYNDLASVDKLTAVNLQIEDVKTVMEGNINRVLENAESLSNIEDKSDNLRHGAQQFARKSEDLRRLLWWRNLKMKLIVGLLVGCVLGYILVPIIVDATS
mmetsp:Transcript_22382/g.26973  ORF Transcript_22382/g.26973 Transcript_22382/m.26973 type:complete len:224 (+) Transcript_22382:295-966(+)